MNRDEQVLKNLDLAEGFLHHILDHPQMTEGRSGTTIVLVPDFDPELADANMTAAREVVHRCPKCDNHVRLKDADKDAPEKETRRSGGVYLQPV